jgi:hypothetical protein
MDKNTADGGGQDGGSMTFPVGRTENILVQVVGDETLLYDSLAQKAYCLNPTLSRIYRVCCGLEVDLTDLSADQIELGLQDLGEQGLLQPSSAQPGFSRRELLSRLALASLAAPAVSSIVVPVAAAAASNACTCIAPAGANARLEGCPCASNNDCCGVCLGGTLTCSATTPPSLPTAAPCCPPPVAARGSFEFRPEDTTGPWPETPAR